MRPGTFEGFPGVWADADGVAQHDAWWPGGVTVACRPSDASTAVRIALELLPCVVPSRAVVRHSCSVHVTRHGSWLDSPPALGRDRRPITGGGCVRGRSGCHWCALSVGCRGRL